MKIYIALGSNLGDRNAYLDRAVLEVAKTPGISGLKMSPVYETRPVGGPEGQENYLNAVMEIQTELAAREILNLLLKVEKGLGRERSVKNAPRTIDLDLIFYGDQVIEDRGLSIPHPRLHEREFVLRPLADLAPDFMHPVLKQSVRHLLTSIEQRA
ncbi:MAG: 2-amino-4-hydroxy-6-hydroxymethyldihydropteridine diphosphokinase [Candidatus Omnitrophica bacterium]|nr:2-amino-4-hydroxy-6-hydroxymethyldihydropteridine diphosphokinase [Candidatus Omnitrophota bacterium]